MYCVVSACFSMQWFAWFLWCHGLCFGTCILFCGDIGFDVECGHVVGGKESLLSSVNVLQPQLCLDNRLPIAPLTLNFSHRECYGVLSAVSAGIRAECYYSNIHSHLHLHWWSCDYCLLDSKQQCSDWGQFSPHHISNTDGFRKCHLHPQTDGDWEAGGTVWVQCVQQQTILC